jgi:hypothetical protein
MEVRRQAALFQVMTAAHVIVEYASAGSVIFICYGKACEEGISSVMFRNSVLCLLCLLCSGT